MTNVSVILPRVLLASGCSSGSLIPRLIEVRFVNQNEGLNGNQHLSVERKSLDKVVRRWAEESNEEQLLPEESLNSVDSISLPVYHAMCSKY